MPRFFVPKDQIPEITGSDAHQIKNVLRMQKGDVLEILDGEGVVHQAKIADIRAGKVVCEITSSASQENEIKVKVTIAQCLPKGKKMDLIIQKCTELSVDKIIPVLSERSIAKADKLERWQKIAKEAAEQCGRSTIPKITSLTKFDDVLSLVSKYDLALIPWELEKSANLKSLLSAVRAPLSAIFLIGPEGGFSHQEIDLAKKAGCIPVSLGKNILRTETAGMAVLAMLSYAFS
ncbi:MAG: 16S rRNA (uracil(1498)-N(3))-methyltransferase [Candidatus Margulisiibacteriota bacterium]